MIKQRFTAIPVEYVPPTTRKVPYGTVFICAEIKCPENQFPAIECHTKGHKNEYDNPPGWVLFCGPVPVYYSNADFYARFVLCRIAPDGEGVSLINGKDSEPNKLESNRRHMPHGVICEVEGKLLYWYTRFKSGEFTIGLGETWRGMANARQKVLAIKQVRDMCNIGLAEAKSVVDYCQKYL